MLTKPTLGAVSMFNRGLNRKYETANRKLSMAYERDVRLNLKLNIVPNINVPINAMVLKLKQASGGNKLF